MYTTDTQPLTNTVTLSGTIASEPIFSHEVYGEKFYEIMLSVKRLSSTADILPISISERLIDDKLIFVGSEVTVLGQFRSYNKLEEEKSKLMLTVFVRDIFPLDAEINPNSIELVGYICKMPIFRTTPFNREISDILLAVNRQYNKSDYIPCIAWGRNARFVKNLMVGQQINVFGRIQSRQYQKRIDDDTTITKTAYEVSVSKIVLSEDFATQIDSDVINA